MNKVDTATIAKRIFDKIAEATLEEIQTRVARLLDLGACGSPIEAMLGAAIVQYDRLIGNCFDPLVICSQDDIGHFTKGTGRELQRLLVYQYRFQNYRIDWVLIDPPIEPSLYFIECDGHDFHERTKEQAAHDRLKDRTIQQSGIPILRFTGSEIYADPIHCASQVFDFVTSKHEPARNAG